MKRILWGTMITLAIGGFTAVASQPEKSPTELEKLAEIEKKAQPIRERERLQRISNKLDQLIAEFRQIESKTSPKSRPCAKEVELRQQLEIMIQQEKAERKAAQKLNDEVMKKFKEAQEAERKALIEAEKARTDKNNAAK